MKSIDDIARPQEYLPPTDQVMGHIIREWAEKEVIPHRRRFDEDWGDHRLIEPAFRKLMVDMDRLGFGPKDGYDPEDLRYITEFIRNFLVDAFKKYYQNNLEKLTSNDYVERHSQYHEVISLFFYHLYRKFVSDATTQLLEDREK